MKRRNEEYLECLRNHSISKMKQPYFVERDLPHLVRKYMETHEEVDVDVLTQHLIDEHYKYRHKKFKPLRRSVTEAYKWNYYLMEKEEKAAKEEKLKKEASSNEVQLQDLDGQAVKEDNGALDDEIIDCIMKKNRKSLPEQQFPTEAPKLVELQGISSLVQPVGQILWRMKECPKQRTYCLRLTGPDNSGKTTLIRALADNMSLPLYFIKVKAVLSGGPLSSPLKKMQEELKKAQEILPGVIVFHHLDLLYSRESSSSSKNEQETVASAVFDFIAGMVAGNDGVKVLIVAETSRPEVLDWHLNQYFTEQLHIAPPSVSDKESILKKLCGPEVDPEVDLTSVALKASGFVAGDLVSLVAHADKLAQDRVCKASAFGQAKSMSDFDPSLKSCYDSDPPKLVVTTEDLMKAVKLVTPSLKRQGFPVIPDTTWADIGGLDLAKKELRDSILKPIKDPEYSSNFGLGENSGVLLWGPPGCGKTLLAKAVANEAGVNLLTVSGPELLSMYQGESERAVREVFARAESVSPCVIFFDEFDSLCPRRSKTGSESGSKSTIVNMLLTEMDGFLTRPGIYLIAATNLPALLDPAVLRPGRFETKLYVGLPTVQGRVAVLKATTKNGTMPRLASDVDLEAIAKREECHNFTGADCKNLVTLAKKIARDEHESMTSKMEVGTAPAPVVVDITDGEPGNKKRKRADGADSNGRPSKAASKDSAAEEPSRSVLDYYPEGEFMLYARHFEAAFEQIEPSVLEEDLRMYELQQKKFMAGRRNRSVVL